MSSIAQLHYSPLAGNNHCFNPARHIFSLQSSHFTDKKLGFNSSLDLTCSSLKSKPFNPDLISKLQPIPCVGGYGGSGAGIHHVIGGGGGNKGNGGGKSDDSFSLNNFGLTGAFLSGWRSRVASNPKFPFKVLMEEVVGVSAYVLGDLASHPNFGLNELDFLFSTLAVGSIMNFTLMYTMTFASASLPFIFANSTTSHMFEPGAYSVVSRQRTFVYKGIVFVVVGIVAGLVGTALSNGLIKMRKKMDPSFESQNKPPPHVLNVVTWVIYMGLSSNFKYQTLNV